MKMTAVGKVLVVLGLVLGLAGCEPQDKSAAILKWQAEGKTEKIIKLLYDPVQAIRVEAIEALAGMQAKEAFAPLGELFKDPDLIVVHAAVEAVAAMGGAEAEPYLLKAIKLDTVPARITSATALGGYGSPEAVDALIGALDDYRYEDVVLAAIKSLGEVGDPKAVAPLTNKLKDRSYNVREACIAALRQIGGAEAMAGIATRLGDVKQTIRDAAVGALLDNGAASAPVVLEALRNENHLARTNAVAVLSGIDAVPEGGSDLVWYRLAELTGEKKIDVDPAKAAVFAGIEDSIPGLLEGVMHPVPEIREYAFIALENVGEPATGAAVALANEKAPATGKHWFSKRGRWSGAPSWRLDLWGAATALNPRFKVNTAYVDLLAKGGSKAEKVMTSEQFRPQRSMVPYLLLQLSDSTSTDEKKVKQAERCRTVAMQQLVAAGYRAVFPLLAALYADDVGIAKHSAQVLQTIGGDRVVQLVVDEYTRQFNPVEETEAETEAEGEETPGVEKPNPYEEFSGTSFHAAMLEFDIPALEPMRQKIRPSEAVAIKDFEEKYPGMTVIVLPLDGTQEATPSSVPIHLSYYNNGKMTDLNVEYRRNRDGSWELDPPLPAALP